MKVCLAFICVLSSLCGGAIAMYSTVSVGANGLNSMTKSLQNISIIMNTYHRNLNNARNRVWPTIIGLQTYVNTTYKTLNNTYGATQQNMPSLMWSMQWFTQQFNYGDQMVSSTVGNDLSQLNNYLQQTIDRIMQSYNMLANSFAYEQNGDACSAQYAGVTSNVPNQLSKFGQCLKNQVDTVPTLVAPLLSIFKMVLNDLKSLNKQLQLCAATSNNCIDAYFMEIQNELSYVNMELYLAQNLLMNFQQDAMQRNQLCGELINANVQDITQNLSMQISQCIYPSMMG